MEELKNSITNLKNISDYIEILQVLVKDDIHEGFVLKSILGEEQNNIKYKLFLAKCWTNKTINKLNEADKIDLTKLHNSYNLIEESEELFNIDKEHKIKWLIKMISHLLTDIRLFNYDVCEPFMIRIIENYINNICSNLTEAKFYLESKI